MILKVIAIESIEPMDLVSLLFDDSKQVSCRQSLPSEAPHGIARRRISDGEFITFDSGQNTDDLLRPRTAHYEAFPTTWLLRNETRPNRLSNLITNAIFPSFVVT